MIVEIICLVLDIDNVSMSGGVSPFFSSLGLWLGNTIYELSIGESEMGTRFSTRILSSVERGIADARYDDHNVGQRIFFLDQHNAGVTQVLSSAKTTVSQWVGPEKS